MLLQLEKQAKTYYETTSLPSSSSSSSTTTNNNNNKEDMSYVPSLCERRRERKGTCVLFIVII
jgi:hypothetical protein